eukprot:TRINITY_DN20617_c0_g1_i7.p1 TRINITY_DN20617_c0_g1~~TRINITY_DN20617_c0_g1_i7.p1  ORF type:complete len:118 (+),score=28.02 TRINITY_DN20617_c0_g1_i7:186-539(+)
MAEPRVVIPLTTVRFRSGTPDFSTIVRHRRERRRAMHSHVLQLDIQGTPQAWVSLEQAVLHYACDDVAWEDGDTPLATMRGGFNVARGVQSRIEVAPIDRKSGSAECRDRSRMPSSA